MASSKLNQLQLLQQNLQNISLQKQQLQNQIVEVDSALASLKTTDKAYKIVGKVMLAISKPDLVKELEQQKEIAEIRLKNFTQQEDKLQQGFEELQLEVMKELQQEKKTEKRSK
ncbi:prefoldin subunit [Candidatus Woesearchaeota archaeon]|nr:prefoldin subunit [Candidatus Woesearchaeota archaeon]